MTDKDKPIATFFCGRCLGTEHAQACSRGHVRVACCHELQELKTPCPSCLDEDAAREKAAAEKAARAATAAAERVAAERAAAEEEALVALEKETRERALAEFIAKELEEAKKKAAEDAKASQEQK